MPNYKLTLSYDGSRYNGWQKQGNTGNTIQEKIEALLTRLLGQPVEIAGCGRTDAGVHARRQVCSFWAETDMGCAELLARLRQYLGFPFEVVAVTLDPQFGGQPVDYSALEALFRRYDVPYEVRRTLIGPIVFDYRNEKNPCSLCAKMRRGALHAAAEELDCSKVALGHHLDDAIETFYMNLWREGRIGCFSPVTELSDRGLTLIRPLLLATEQEVRCAVKEEGFPIVKSRCPADGVTTREDTKNFVRERCRTDRAFRQKTLHALQESGIDGWRPVHTGRGSFAITNEEE